MSTEHVDMHLLDSLSSLLSNNHLHDELVSFKTNFCSFTKQHMQL